MANEVLRASPGERQAIIGCSRSRKGVCGSAGQVARGREQFCGGHAGGVRGAHVRQSAEADRLSAHAGSGVESTRQSSVWRARPSMTQPN